MRAQCSNMLSFFINFFLSLSSVLVSFSSLFSLLSHFSSVTPSHPTFFLSFSLSQPTLSPSSSLKSHKKHPHIVANYPKKSTASQTLYVLPCIFGLLLQPPSSQRIPYLSPPPLKLKLKLQLKVKVKVKVKSHPLILAQEDFAMFADSRLPSPRGLLCNVGASIAASMLFCLLPEKIDKKKIYIEFDFVNHVQSFDSFHFVV